jgi:hypothetical protein
MAYQTPHVTVYVDEPETAESQTSSSRRRQGEPQHWLDSDNPLRHVRMRLQATSNPDPFVDDPVPSEMLMAAPGLPSAAATQRCWAKQQTSSSTEASGADNNSPGGHVSADKDSSLLPKLEDFYVYGGIFYQPYRRPPYQPIPTLAQVLEHYVPMGPHNRPVEPVYSPVAAPAPTTATNAELTAASNMLRRISLEDNHSDQHFQRLTPQAGTPSQGRQTVNASNLANATGKTSVVKRNSNIGLSSANTHSSAPQRKRKREHDATGEEDIKRGRHIQAGPGSESPAR